MAEQWFYKLFGEEFGPASAATIADLIDSGMLDAEDELRCGSTGRRRSARKVAAGAGDSAILTAPPPPPAVSTNAPQGSDSLADMLAFAPDWSPEAEAPGPVGSDAASPEGNAWYCRVLDNEIGPMSRDDLQEMAERGNLERSDLVRCGASGKWVEAGTVGTLFPAAQTTESKRVEQSPAAAAPAAPGSPEVSSPAQQPAVNTQHINQQQAAQYVWFGWLGGREYGPLAFEQLQAMVMQGYVAPHDYVRTSTNPQWFHAGWVPGLFGSAAVAQPATQQTVPVSEPAKRPEPPAAPAETGWFYQAGDVIHGPIPKDELREKARRRELQPETQARFGTRGEWIRLGSIRGLFPAEATRPIAVEPGRSEEAPVAKAMTPSPGETKTPAPAAKAQEPPPPQKKPAAAASPAAPEPAPEPTAVSLPIEPPSVEPVRTAAPQALPASAPRPSMPPAPKPKRERSGPSVFERLKDPKVLAVAAVVVLVVGLKFLWPLMNFGGGGMEDYNQLDAIYAELRQKRESNAPAAEWDAFAAQAGKRGQEIAAVLDKEASAATPGKQHLLWAARDYLPGMLSGARSEPNEDERKFLEHLRQARALLMK